MSWVEQRIRRLWYPVVLAGVAALSLISMGEFEPVEGSLYAALFLGATYLGLKKRAARP